MIDLVDIQRVADLARSYAAERKKYARLSEKSHGAVTPRQAQKSNADLNWQAMAMIKIEAELHSACVDAGLADLRDAAHYAERELRPSGWHRYLFTPRQPRALARQDAA